MSIDHAQLEAQFKSKYDFEDNVLLGEGTYGKVKKARNRSTNEVVAMKEMKMDNGEDGVPATAIREIALLKELGHENVVQLQEVFCKPGKLILVFEFMDGDLKKFMKARSGRLAPSVVKSFSRQMLCGMEFLHSSRIIHRDIKPQNLLIDRSETMKIADFGLARAYSIPMPEYTHEVITVWYRPLEILLGGKLYSLPVDLWSCGCVVAEMASGGPLFAGDSEIDTIFKIFQKLGTPTEQQWPGISELPDFKPTFPQWPKKPWTSIRNTSAQMGENGIDLLEGLLDYDPRKRTSARASLSHPYIVASVATGGDTSRAEQPDASAEVGVRADAELGNVTFAQLRAGYDRQADAAEEPRLTAAQLEQHWNVLRVVRP